jgi:hypothetical protein
MTFNKIQIQPTLRRGNFPVRVFSGLLLLLTAFVLLSTATASAQLSGKGEIKGVVTDSSGAVIPGAVVTATSTTTGTRSTRTTSNSGDFDITPLDPGIYSVAITAKGFEKLTQEDVHVNALEVADLKLALTIGSENQSVEVSAAPPALETSNATLGATMEQEMYAALPIQMGAAGSPDQRQPDDEYRRRQWLRQSRRGIGRLCQRHSIHLSRRSGRYALCLDGNFCGCGRPVPGPDLRLLRTL